MNKRQVSRFLTNNHEKLRKTISRLERHQTTEDIILGKWTPKDIIAHISAWNFELKKAIDDLLNDEKPWFINEEELTESVFNERAIKQRKNWQLDQVLEDWQISFDQLIQRIQELADSEWNYQTPFEWTKDMPVTVDSLFEYKYRGEGHEGGHAKQIEEFYQR
ncbi:MAG: ClbS/DfsB family four-helix bundle protein [Candidatus Thorarchaeota archaeon]